MKKTLIALTALVAATVGFQSQAQAGHKHKSGSGVQFELQFGNGSGFSIGNGFTRVHRPYRYSPRRHRPFSGPYSYKNPYNYNNGYTRPYVCNIAGKRKVRRSLRARGFYDIRRIRQKGRFYSAKAVSPRGYLVKLKVNACNLRIVKRKFIRNYSPGYNYGNAWKTNW